MQKLETINTKQIVTESVETKKVITESVARRVVKESADPVFTSSIARGLVEEFGYDLDERIMPDGKGGMTPSAAQSIAQQSAPTATAGTPPPPAVAAPAASNPYQGADAAKFASLSPEDQAWLTKGGGKPDINDQFILARAPNKGKAVATAPGAAPGGAGTKPAAPAAPTGTTAQGDDEGNTMITKPDGTVQVVGPDGNAIPQGGGKETPPGGATKPAAADPAVAATREKFKALMDKLEKTGGVSSSAPAPAPTASKPATGAATKKSAPAATMPAVNAMGDATGVQERLLQDDQTLLAIRNIRY